MVKSDRIALDAGSGGGASHRLINDLFLRYFDNEILARMDDAALLRPETPEIAMSTDSYTVSPLFFPGASIGSLAINGTVNDIAMLGAKPRWLTAAFIIEEGLEVHVLERVVEDMAAAAREAGVKIVSGDTKVVPKGACDQLFITTSGIGSLISSPAPSGHSAKPGDVILVSGTVGDHGLAVMAARSGLSFLSDVKSDCAPLNHAVEALIQRAGTPHTLRDPTRGGLATTLNEIASQSDVCVELFQDKIPVAANIEEGCAVLGLDPLYLANEGKFICVLPEDRTQEALAAMRESPYCQKAALIGRITDRRAGKVIMHTRMGGERYLGMLEGAQLPRIC